jgi:hypothetical protein
MKGSKYVEMDSSVRGQKISRPFGRDDSSFPVNDKEAKNGKDMGGGTTNLSHSLTGASAVQDGSKKP